MKKHLFVLLACLFVVMIGFGITLPVLAFYVERLALKGGASRQSIVLHVTLLTSVYALMQLLFAPVWGRWSDRIGRRPLLLLGIAGFVMAQVLSVLPPRCGCSMRPAFLGAFYPRRPFRSPRPTWPT